MAVPEAEWRQRIFGALSAVVVVGLVIGGVLGAVAYSTARATGLAGEAAPAPVSADASDGGEQRAAADAPSASSTPEPASDTTVEATTGTRTKNQKPTEGKPQDGRRDGQRAKMHLDKSKQKHDRTGKPARPSLDASPRHVRRMGRIRLVGRYPGHGGARLVVQRFERGHWARFPVSATVRDGRFRTWVASGHRGVNRFRVVDVRSRRASAAVTVRVG